MCDCRAKRFRPLFRLAGETLNARGDFFPQRSAFIALPLLRAGHIVPQTRFEPRFERTVRSHAGEQQQIQYEDYGKDGKDSGVKHFGNALFYSTADQTSTPTKR